MKFMLIFVSLFLSLSAVAEDYFVLKRDGRIYEYEVDGGVIDEVGKIEFLSYLKASHPNYSFLGVIANREEVFFSVGYFKPEHGNVAEIYGYSIGKNKVSFISNGKYPSFINGSLCFARDLLDSEGSSIVCVDENGSERIHEELPISIGRGNSTSSKEGIAYFDIKQKVLKLIQGKAVSNYIAKLDYCVPVAISKDYGIVCRGKEWGKYFFVSGGMIIKAENFIPRLIVGNSIIGIIVSESLGKNQVSLSRYDIGSGGMESVEFDTDDISEAAFFKK
ncbi:hypothetical protein KJI95_04040 [Shewanella sp. JM162201]|uniref:Phosphodiester glycosidase domain-containing protein n=1 Tax=Shewanella jiangmenensis TaxID=2837387 RepID=A0ABS5UZT7_9GAMM|nr:hypothetical protein [Shewanella jiangmenensis]MBT1443695.1 hypothetical protein [Shewanella jiangmenensis]